MNKHNHFSERFKKKTSKQLQAISTNNQYDEYARLAAIWELELRNEANNSQSDLANEIIQKQELKQEKSRQLSKYQTFGPRFIASLIDGIVIILIYFLINQMASSPGAASFINTYLSDFVPFIYSVLLHGAYGQTLGKKLMSIRVVDHTTEESISFKQALIRDSIPISILLLFLFLNIGLLFTYNSFQDVPYSLILTVSIISYIPVLWWLIEVVSLLMNEKSRAVHDLIAKTVVIRIFK